MKTRSTVRINIQSIPPQLRARVLSRAEKSPRLRPNQYTRRVVVERDSNGKVIPPARDRVEVNRGNP